jgi:chromosome segregation protein
MGREVTERSVALLKLKKVELLGFKSFCEKTVITFSGSGTTCIVGPNGCGKSNIVDAISWVLGEQSHKSLRAERMADCIFNGTQKRPPMGMSEVTITMEDPELADAARFVLGEESQEAEEVEDQSAESVEANVAADFSPANPQSLNAEDTARSAEDTETAEQTGIGDTPAARELITGKRKRRMARPIPQMRPGEVVVGRRLYRSGQSEYLINGRPARLRDVQELFMGTGLGPESYAIIEQGRIGQVLSSKPMDRRAIIEEAAGVTKYKTKKRLAEAKLESSKINLARVNDILVEIEKQLASLKRQASKARRYAELREQLRGLMRQVLGSKAIELDAEAQRLADLLRLANETENRESESLHALESEQHRLTQRNYELETEIRQTNNLFGQCSLELDRAENRVGFNRERMKELDGRVQQIANEAAQALEQAELLESSVKSHELGVATQREENNRLAAALEAMTQRGAAFAGIIEYGDRRMAELRAEAAQLTDEMARLDREHAQAEATFAHVSENRARMEQAEQQIRASLEENSQRAEIANAAWREADAQSRALDQSVRIWQARIVGLKHEQQSTKQRYERLRDELAGVRARKSSIEQILTEHSYTTDSIQKLFASNAGGTNGFRAVGVLADYADVEEQYESAVEQYLKDELQYVVVETFDLARAGITMLREEVGGRATFFVDSLRKLNIPAMEREMPFHAGQGVLARMDKVVQFRDPLGPAAVNFLPRLQTAFLVESAGAAEQLASEHPQYQFVTTEGTCYAGRLVSGGRPGEAGPLAMKRELRALEAQTADSERQAEEAQSILRRIEEELDQCEGALAETITRHREAEKALVATSHAREQAGVEVARVERQLAECVSETQRLRNDAEAAEQRITAARTQRDSTLQARTAAETELAKIAARVITVRTEMQSHQESLAAKRAELATMAERLATAEQIEQRLAAELREMTARANALAEHRASLAQERSDLEANTAEIARQLEGLGAEKLRLTERKAQLEHEWEQARVRAVEVDDTLRMARQRLGDLREQRAQHEIEQARNESDRQHLREQCVSELNLQPEDLIAELTSAEPGSAVRVLTGEELAAADTTFREIKARIEAMGAVNMMALEEYQECEQRNTFLSRERDDLVQSITDTQQTIKELDEVTRIRFEEAFKVINANFAQCFQTLFGGGHAEMRLTEMEGGGDPGIEVIASPPGKRLQNVLLLSGGEKALTALSLLIGIFRYQPSPFCILDEVDAPLDEANVGRFTRLISEMSSNTQFLVVTHNRRTMETAGVLYGVTMQEPGVSKLVSVKWEDQAQTTAA